jgi:hypothetical protein
MIQKGGFDVVVKLQYQEVRPRPVEPAVGASPCLRFGGRDTRCPTHRW